MQLTLSANNLRTIQAVASCAGTDDARPLLTRLVIQETPAELMTRIGSPLCVVATDSYRLAVGSLDGAEGTCEQTLIPAKGLASMSKAQLVAFKHAEPATPVYTLTAEEKSYSLSSPASSATEENWDTGTYPNWPQLVPAESEEHAPGMVAFNPHYLAEVAKAAKTLKVTDATPVRMMAIDKTRPATFTIKHHAGVFLYLLMPVRVS
jgi:DNA polymerase III sliding clamp (beta) subunit (PCNA family)